VLAKAPAGASVNDCGCAADLSLCPTQICMSTCPACRIEVRDVQSCKASFAEYDECQGKIDFTSVAWNCGHSIFDGWHCIICSTMNCSSGSETQLSASTLVNCLVKD
jgi:hypothetical protein